MKILVTGANGLLGQKLVALLQQDDAIQLIATAQRTPVMPIMRGTFTIMDIADRHNVLQVIDETRPDVIIHTAAMTNVDQCETEREACWKTNVLAVEYLTEAANAYDAHLIHLSTDFIFDGTEGPLEESAAPDPVNFYGESKLQAERYIQTHATSWCILRTVLVYGITPDMSRSNIILWVKKSLEEGKTIQVVDDQYRTPTLAEDLAMGCYLAAKKKASGIYHVSGKDFLTPYAMAIHTAEYFGLDTTLIKKTDSHQFRQTARRPLRTGFIIDKARHDLGYEPHSFTEGIALLHQQLRGLPPVKG
jgi:dTDP-4-dehydrorhamnose reductase